MSLSLVERNLLLNSGVLEVTLPDPNPGVSVRTGWPCVRARWLANTALVIGNFRLCGAARTSVFTDALLRNSLCGVATVSNRRCDYYRIITTTCTTTASTTTATAAVTTAAAAADTATTTTAAVSATTITTTPAAAAAASTTTTTTTVTAAASAAILDTVTKRILQSPSLYQVV